MKQAVIRFIVGMVMMGVFTCAQAQLSLCRWYPWRLTGCTAMITYQDGTVRDMTFYPENKAVTSCYRFGCHPYYCADWRDGIRKACQEEFEVLKARAEKMFGVKEIKSITFEGCAAAEPMTGVLGPADKLVRKLAPASFYNICTTDPEESEGQLARASKAVWEQLKKVIARVPKPS